MPMVFNSRGSQLGGWCSPRWRRGSGCSMYQSRNIWSQRSKTKNIRGLKPRYEGQKPSKDHNHDGLALYGWARVKRKSGHYERFKLKMVSDSKSEDGEGDSLRTEEVRGPTGPRLLITRGVKPVSLVETHSKPFDHMTKSELTICPGVDPCLIIALVASMEQMKRREENVSSQLDCLDCLF